MIEKQEDGEWLGERESEREAYTRGCDQATKYVGKYNRIEWNEIELAFAKDVKNMKLQKRSRIVKEIFASNFICV